ncbi:MAG TPA: methyltransferase domain-containing protein [Chloroflexota bacterium]|nr:methyltransferase domain-containing protein [Chloroflexota bacterium]
MAEINLLHRYPRAKRNIAARNAAQVQQRDVAMQFGREYFDGDRSQGYGGYRYDGRWVPIAETLRDHWNLKPGDRVLDIGCAKGFLVRDLMTVCAGLEVVGLDISDYALVNAETEARGHLVRGNAACLPFQTNSFRAAISINTIHNLERPLCVEAVREMGRVAPEGGYIQVDSYRTPDEREEFMKWVLTARTHDYPEGWKALFQEAGYTGDYYWTIIE